MDAAADRAVEADREAVPRDRPVAVEQALVRHLVARREEPDGRGVEERRLRAVDEQRVAAQEPGVAGEEPVLGRAQDRAIGLAHDDPVVAVDRDRRGTDGDRDAHRAAMSGVESRPGSLAEPRLQPVGRRQDVAAGDERREPDAHREDRRDDDRADREQDHEEDRQRRPCGRDGRARAARRGAPAPATPCRPAPDRRRSATARSLARPGSPDPRTPRSRSPTPRCRRRGARRRGSCPSTSSRAREPGAREQDRQRLGPRGVEHVRQVHVPATGRHGAEAEQARDREREGHRDDRRGERARDRPDATARARGPRRR